MAITPPVRASGTIARSATAALRTALSHPEPSAGTGLLAILAEISGSPLILNELAETRADLLSSLFPAVPLTRFDAAQIDDHLDHAAVPSVVIMNPPFSVLANVNGRVADAAYRHLASALARLADGGRLVAITGANFSPEQSAWSASFRRLQKRGRLVFTAAIAGAVYAKHGTTIEMRLTAIDKTPADDPSRFPASAGIAPDIATLLGWMEQQIPPPMAVSMPKAMPDAAPRTFRGYLARTAASAPARRTAEIEGAPLDYETVDWTPPEGGRLSTRSTRPMPSSGSASRERSRIRPS